MTDIVERLRFPKTETHLEETAEEAADEIERLRKLCYAKDAALVELKRECTALRADRLYHRGPSE